MSEKLTCFVCGCAGDITIGKHSECQLCWYCHDKFFSHLNTDNKKISLLISAMEMAQKKHIGLFDALSVKTNQISLKEVRKRRKRKSDVDIFQGAHRMPGSLS